MGTRISCACVFDVKQGWGRKKKKKRGHRRHIVQLSITEKIEINDETLETSCIERERKKNVGKRKLKKERRKKNEHKEIPRCFRQYAVFWILL